MHIVDEHMHASYCNFHQLLTSFYRLLQCPRTCKKGRLYSRCRYADSSDVFVATDRLPARHGRTGTARLEIECDIVEQLL